MTSPLVVDRQTDTMPCWLGTAQDKDVHALAFPVLSLSVYDEDLVVNLVSHTPLSFSLWNTVFPNLGPVLVAASLSPSSGDCLSPGELDGRESRSSTTIHKLTFLLICKDVHT